MAREPLVHCELRLIEELVPVHRCFDGLVRSQRYQPNQQLEIYNFRVVPELQISKEVDFYNN